MTEVVLLFPIFMIIVFFMAKIFALLVLVQKMEIASYYAARRYQLESHLNVDYAKDDNELRLDIEKRMRGYLGLFDTAVSDEHGNVYSRKQFLGIKDVRVDVVRTQVWNVVTLTVETNPSGMNMLCKYPKQVVCAQPYGAECIDGYDYLCSGGKKLEVVKYVPSRDRPIQFVLPGLK